MRYLPVLCVFLANLTGCLTEDKILDNSSPDSATEADAGTTFDTAPDSVPDVSSGTDAQADPISTPDATVEDTAQPRPDATPDGSEEPDVVEPDTGDDVLPTSCGFQYEQMFADFKENREPPAPFELSDTSVFGGDGVIAHLEPPPPYVFTMSTDDYKDSDDIIMPGYDDNMPLFERAEAWDTATRCYETPLGAAHYTETEAYNLYRTIAELTTGVQFDASAEVRTVVGLRGAYPGTFDWHGNTPDQFNDTLVLLWKDSEGDSHVREFPVHTDVGARDFGENSSSSLYANRRFQYTNGAHRDYSALRIAETNYRVRNDTNNNGHWDSDRNGWLPPYTGEDYFRGGSAHNIHMGSVDGPLGEARVQSWSAGCQVIPGIDNWTEFIFNAWTDYGDPVNYFILDARDIAPEVWEPCVEDGSHRCPYRVEGSSFTHTASTTVEGFSEFDTYNCSGADESGPEIVYVMTVDQTANLSVSVICDDPVVDIDVHLLDGDDANACLERDHWDFTYDITPGRYFIVADTFVDGDDVLSGPYTITVTLD